MSRSTISAAHLYAVLDREFRARRPGGCVQCSTPLPYFRQPPDDVSANWEVGTPKFCPNGCHIIFAELLARLWTEYELEQTAVQ